MKFKKSNILLISLISLFLLLSISAASAASDADGIAQDLAMNDIGEIEDIDNDENNLMNANILSEGVDDAPENNELKSDSTQTTMEASNETYKFGDNITINVSVKDNNGKAINITKNDFTVSCSNASENNYTNVNFALNDESKIQLVFPERQTLSVGSYDVKIKFNKTIADTQYLNEAIAALNIQKSDTRINASDVKVNLGREIIPLTVMLESNRTLNFNASNITVYLADDPSTIFYCKNGSGGNNVSKDIKLIGFDKPVGNYSIVIKFNGTDNSNPSEKTIVLSVLENITIKTDDKDKITLYYPDKEVKIPFSIVDANNTNLTVAEEDLKLLVKYNKSTEEVIEKIPGDAFELTGNATKYTLSFNTTLDFNPNLYKAEIILIYKNGTISETNKTISLESHLKAHIELVDGGSEAEYQFGNFTFRLVDDGNKTLANYNVSIGSDGGLEFFTVSDDRVSSSTSRILTSDDEGYIRFNGNFIHNNFNTGLIMIYNYDFTSLPVGSYNITFYNNGFLKLSTYKTQITVNPAPVKIIASNKTGEYGNLLHYTFQLVHAKTGEPVKASYVQFKIVSSNINEVRNGTTNLTGWYTSPALNLTGGKFNLTLNTIDSNLNSTTKNVKRYLTVTPRKAVLSASNRTIYYNSGYSAIVNLKDKKTGKNVANDYVLIRVYTTSSKYTNFLGKTNKNGNVYLSTPLSVGKHKIIIQTYGGNYNASKITRYLTVKKASAKITAPKVSTYYKSGKAMQIKLTNTKNNKVMYYSTLNIKLYISKTKYYNYTGTTNGSGIVLLKPTLKPGTYKVVISPYDKGYTAKAVTSQIKVTKSPIKIAPTALKVKKGKYFKVKVTSTKTKKVLSNIKVKVKVYTGKKYKTYTIKTNKKGIASLKISQKVGKHKVVLSPGSPAYYSAKALTKTLTVTK